MSARPLVVVPSGNMSICQREREKEEEKEEGGGRKSREESDKERASERKKRKRKKGMRKQRKESESSKIRGIGSEGEIVSLTLQDVYTRLVLLALGNSLSYSWMH